MDFHITVYCQRKSGQGPAETQRQELKKRPQTSVAHWFVPLGSLSLLSCTPQDQPSRLAPPTLVWALPHPSLTKKLPIGLPAGQSSRDISSAEVLSSQMTLYCQTGIKIGLYRKPSTTLAILATAVQQLLLWYSRKDLFTNGLENDLWQLCFWF